MKILYIASASILEPLIESQVLRYMESLAKDGCTFDLVTFERTNFDESQVDEIKGRLRTNLINWKPRWISSSNRSFGILQDIKETAQELIPYLRENPVDLIHARSFLPGNIAIRIKKKLGIPVLYDMRGLWAREKFAYGRIKLLPAKWLAQWMENRVIKNADFLVSLTNNGIMFLRNLGVKNPIECIPCCVDLESFQLPPGDLPLDPVRLISVGSLGKGYRCDAVFRFAKAFANQHPNVHLDLITRTDQDQIHSIANQLGVERSFYSIKSVSHSEVANEVSSATIGVCMIAPSESKIASCPTKLGEYLACGLPVVANVPIGDVEEILNQNRVGISMHLDQDSFDTVAADMLNLIADPNIRTRARAAAEEIFNVESGAAKYKSIYDQIVSNHPSVA